MASPLRVGIIGASSYTGRELVSLLSRHSRATIAFAASRSFAGQPFSALYPALKGIYDESIIPLESAGEREIDCLFSCLPHAVSAGLCIPFIERGVRVIDLSADFRLTDADVYEKWYKTTHPAPELLSRAVFGLPERYRDKIAATAICANPGCYPTSIMLPLLPLFDDPDFAVSNVIADSKSGASGAGRSLKQNTHFVEANENFSAYGIGRAHRHISEIDQELSRAAGREVTVTFSPHLLPVNRGILSTIYFNSPKSAAECLEKAAAVYRDEPFVRVREAGDFPALSGVVHTNYCDITYTGGVDGQPLIAVSAIDNLLKGASGQAVQNMNIMFGCNEIDGLR